VKVISLASIGILHPIVAEATVALSSADGHQFAPPSLTAANPLRIIRKAYCAHLPHPNDAESVAVAIARWYGSLSMTLTLTGQRRCTMDARAKDHKKQLSEETTSDILRSFF
jgi:hypothetical protein